jgi:chromosome segregation ATPase
LAALIKAEVNLASIEDENYALIEQVKQSHSDILSLQGQFSKIKQNNTERVSELTQELDKCQAQIAKKDAEIIFLEDHARFSNEQTKLSISHWDLLLKNRDENIELLTARINQLTADTRANNPMGVSVDKYKCLLERYQVLKEQLPIEKSEIAKTEDKVECPWRQQADVRVAQLERVTSQLNSIFEQLHAKSDELLLQNRTLGSIRSRNFELEAKVRRYKARITTLKHKLNTVLDAPDTSDTAHQPPLVPPVISPELTEEAPTPSLDSSD